MLVEAFNSARPVTSTAQSGCNLTRLQVYHGYNLFWFRLTVILLVTDLVELFIYFGRSRLQVRTGESFGDLCGLEHATEESINDRMILGNNVTSIILLGFSDLQSFPILFFSLFVLIYCGTITGNLLILVFFLASKSLQSPMYLFITQLSLCDILVTTDILPTLLHTVLYGGGSVSFIGCILQFCIFALSECSECLLLSLMSYDRYLAICHPLHYHSVMNHVFCVTSVVVIWLIGMMVMLIDVISILSFHFCGRNVIDHFYCDLEPLVQLFCSDTSIIHEQILIIGILVLMVPFIVIVLSYVYIAITILKIPSITGRQKAFTTCSSHLTVVSIFYGTLIISYMFPTKGRSLILNKFLSLMYTMVTPLLNPIVYTLRNKDFKEAFRKMKLGL
ncbi:olfactory receptor 11A1-like [Hyla sarda]|uniref:olfactory receptor 11A1-like n=1 Tax=Hyla sarda TaxID=327740 RepID=UPI0024C31EC1|nr:olfactory receptor 11A1-like [Hyla sarda]